MYYYNMKKIDWTGFGTMKKISLNMAEEILEIIDSLADITHTNRTVVIGAVIGKGLSPYFSYLEESCKKALKDKNLEEKKRKILVKALEDVQNLEKTKWTG